MDNTPIYANWWSKLLFRKSFEEQFYIPVPQSKLSYALLASIEKLKFSDVPASIKIDKPIFICGLPRSGTTLLYNLLSAHESAAYITNSINAFIDYPCAIEWLRKKLNFNISGERFLADSIDTDFASPSEPIMYWRKWFLRDVATLYWKEQRKTDFPPEHIAAIYSDIRKIISTFDDLAAGQPRPQRRFVLKYPLMQTELRMLQDIFPDAKFIHIVRDGRAVANSLVKLYNLSNSQIRRIRHPLIDHIIPYPRVARLKEYVETYGADSVECTSRVWVDALNLVHDAAADLTNFKEIRYEDLLARPHLVMADLFQFCEMPWPAESNEAFAKTLSSVGQTRHTNNYGQFYKVEKVARQTLEHYGYE